MAKRGKAVVILICIGIVALAAALWVVPLLRTPTATTHLPTTVTTEPDRFAMLRKHMVEAHMKARDVTDPAVLAVMEKIPRHHFVRPEDIDRAYDDNPLPIGYGQTISQPYMVAIMTQLLKIKRGDKVLEIGTGSGYQAAVLAELTDQVYTVEIIPELAESARKRLAELGYTNIHTRNADGYYGWKEYAPYDAIIVTAAPDHIPQPLIEQLADGGRMVIPVGPPGWIQTLWFVEKHGAQVTSRQVMDVMFVPLTGAH